METNPADRSESGRKSVAGESTLDRLANKDVIESIAGIMPGDHISVFYEYSPLEYMPAVIAYLRDGLALGEQCIYIADETPVPLFEQWMQAENIDLAAEKERGALLVWTREEWREPGPLDSIRKAAQVRAILEAAFASGFGGVRFAVEMTWTLGPDIPAESIEAWEANSTAMMSAGAPLTAMCLYGRRRLSPESLDAGLRTHPFILDDQGMRPNEGYTGPSA